MGSATPSDHRSGFVAVVGRPNVGKSTLVNALVGEKVTIVAPRPQTTRRRVIGIRTTPDAQAVLVDTPGIHEPQSELDRRMVRVARRAIPDADVVVWVVDVSVPPTGDDLRIAEWLYGARPPVILALNKSDRLKPADIAERTAAYCALVNSADWLLTIATERHNVDRLWLAVESFLPPGPAWYPDDQVSDQTERLFVAELIREAALHLLGQEVPHGIEVVIEDWALRASGVLYVAARVLVERESHKGIVIGAGGATLKRIGTRARLEVQRVLGRRVYLELFVAVRPGWRERSADLRQLGYE